MRLILFIYLKTTSMKINWKKVAMYVLRVIERIVTGAGAGMLRNIPLMLDITREVVKAVNVPVTVKTRLGWDFDNLIITELAEQFGKTYDDELHRVIIHGILHLCGINDTGPGEREIMEENENKALALLEGASILKK